MISNIRITLKAFILALALGISSTPPVYANQYKLGCEIQLDGPSMILKPTVEYKGKDQWFDIKREQDRCSNACNKKALKLKPSERRAALESVKTFCFSKEQKTEYMTDRSWAISLHLMVILYPEWKDWKGAPPPPTKFTEKVVQAVYDCHHGGECAKKGRRFNKNPNPWRKNQCIEVCQKMIDKCLFVADLEDQVPREIKAAKKEIIKIRSVMKGCYT